MVSYLKPYQQPQTSKINRRSLFRNKLSKKHLIEQVVGDEVGDEFLIWLRIYRVKSEMGFVIWVWKWSGSERRAEKVSFAGSSRKLKSSSSTALERVRKSERRRTVHLCAWILVRREWNWVWERESEEHKGS